MTRRDVVEICRKLGGVARSKELAPRGEARAAIGAACHRGALLRLRIGWYALPDAPSELVQAVLHGGILACSSALQAMGVWVMPFHGVHVDLRADGHARQHIGCRCREHWEHADTPMGSGRRDLEREARSDDVIRWLAQLLRCQGDEAFFVAVESSLRIGLLAASHLSSLAATIPDPKRRLIDLAVATSDSGLESLLRLRLLAIGISMTAQVAIPTVGIVDFLLGDRLILEVDGRPNHDGPSMRHKDLVRDANATILGFITLRFDYAMVMYDWGTVEAAILAALERGHHRTDAGMRMDSMTRG